MSNLKPYYLIICLCLCFYICSCRYISSPIKDSYSGVKEIELINRELAKNGHTELANDFIKSGPRLFGEAHIVSYLKEGDQRIDRLKQGKAVIEQLGAKILGRPIIFEIVALPKENSVYSETN